MHWWSFCEAQSNCHICTRIWTIRTRAGVCSMTRAGVCSCWCVGVCQHQSLQCPPIVLLLTVVVLIKELFALLSWLAEDLEGGEGGRCTIHESLFSLFGRVVTWPGLVCRPMHICTAQRIRLHSPLQYRIIRPSASLFGFYFGLHYIGARQSNRIFGRQPMNDQRLGDLKKDKAFYAL